MRWARALVLLLAAGSATGAAMIVRKAAPPQSPRQAEAPRPQIELTVLRRPIAAGELVEEKDLRWQPWPDDALPAGAIARRRGEARSAFEPARSRYPLLEGEPLAEAKLIRPGDGGVMAALIAPGMRAIAVPVREESAAGGLIQPNDRVDVLWTRRAGEGSSDAGTATRTLLRGARVLAIGHSTDGKSRNSDGRTATLELTPEQAGTIASARASGEISLALIPAADIASLSQPQTGAAWDDDPEQTTRIIKFGRQPSGQSGLRGAR
jgi:pilus assembly protein CpaB